MNKKILMFGVLGLFALGLVVAGVITYYTQVQQEFNIQSPISDGSLATAIIEGYLQSPQLGTLVSVTNLADFDVDVNVNSEAREIGHGITDLITTSYVNTLRLTKKTVVFGDSPWTEVAETNKIVEYNVVGGSLSANIAEGDEEDGYVLIYYADNADRFNNVATAVGVNDVDASLPYEGDANAVGGVYNYCDADSTTGENYETCNGAKIWYVPISAIPGGVVDWSQASEFYFETDLIYYFNAVDGNTVIPEGVSMEFNPLYEFGAINGTYTVITSVIPA